jgi:hypothetical protein
MRSAFSATGQLLDLKCAGDRKLARLRRQYRPLASGIAWVNSVGILGGSAPIKKRNPTPLKHISHKISLSDAR